ncbi:MAG: hypothetical protein ACLPKB_15895 [Xanthobacteraceae bacterium]
MSISFNQAKTSAVISVVGLLIRHSYYLVGALVLGFAGIFVLPHWQPQPAPRVKPPMTAEIEQKPAFRLATTDLTQLPMTARIFTVGAGDRIEALQFGHLHDRDTDFTLAIIMPATNQMPAGDLVLELNRLRALRLLQPARTWTLHKYYDLETRFGPVRAAEMQLDVDGQRKLCLAFVSRFATPAVYLAGWHCLASGANPVPAELACTLDHLVLDARLASEPADAFFRKGQARPASCSAAPVTQTTDTRPSVPPPRRR